ncbi:MAG: mercuric transport protein MerTP [Bacteroidota bacterium]
MSTKKPKGALLTGMIAAIAASSCCIPPVIAAIAGAGGATSSMSWMEPYRPYLIVLAVIAIGYAWYSHFKPKKEDDCSCSIQTPKWYQTKTFLISMTLFAALSIGFPYYSGKFFTDNAQNVVLENKKNVETIEVTISGMTCDACQNHVDYAVNELDGIVSIKTSYTNGNSIIQFDKTKTNQQQIKNAINSTGYAATSIKSK